jgi:hypothetical protein
MGNIVGAAVRRCGIQSAAEPRLYVIPPSGFDINSRVARLGGQSCGCSGPHPSHGLLCVLAFFSPAVDAHDPSSRPFVCTPPSEPSGVTELDKRDGKMCVICGESPTQVRHIVDGKRRELLFGLEDD